MSKRVRVECEIEGCDGHRNVAVTHLSRTKPLCKDHYYEQYRKRMRTYMRKRTSAAADRGVKILRSETMPEGAELMKTAVDDFVARGAFQDGDLLQNMNTGERLVVTERQARNGHGGAVFDLQAAA